MAASNRPWITISSTLKMVVTFGLLLLLAGLPIREISAVETKNPSSKECRAHVEKALDQYFDSKDTTGPDSARKPTREAASYTTHLSDQDDDDDDDDDSPIENKRSIETEDEEDQEDDKACDDDDDDDDDDDEEGENPANDKTEEDEDENDDDEDDENVKTETDDDDDNEENDQDDGDDEDEDDSEENETKTAKSTTNELADDDDDDEDEEDDEKQEITVHNKDNLSTGQNSKSHGDEHDEESDDVDDDDDEDRNEDDEVTSHPESNIKEVKESEGDQDDEEEDEEEQTDEAANDNDDDEDDEETTDDDTATSSITTDKQIHQPATKYSDAEKATGSADRPSSGVAQELSSTTAAPQQSQAQEDEEEKETEQAVSDKPAEGNHDAKESIALTSVQDEDDDDEYDDKIENIYEEEDDDDTVGVKFRSRDHIDAILGLDDVGTDYDHQEDKLAQTIFRDIKRIHAMSIKPIEQLYKFTESTSRLLGDAEIFSKPMILFLGPWSTGKTTIINYLLGIERTTTALKTGTGITDVDFSVMTYGDQRQTISGTELAADWRYASLQKFGQGFLDHFKSITMPHTLLKKVNLVDTPGILESMKNTDRGYSLNDACQWFIDRADAIYVVLDPSKVDIGAELGKVLDQLKGREVRFILDKADSIRRSDLMKVVGQLFWNLSPLMSGTEAPVIYAVSLSTIPFNPTAPAKFLFDQESNFLYDLKDTMGKRVENRILYARRHAVRVRNHAKMIDCYLSTYYKHKSIFSSKRNVAKLITENPTDYHIYEGLHSMTNVSRYDIPDPTTYKNFFKQHALYDFKPLSSTCSYFRGCPMDKLDNAIANELPELFAKYKKAKNDSPPTATKQEGR